MVTLTRFVIQTVVNLMNGVIFSWTGLDQLLLRRYATGFSCDNSLKRYKVPDFVFPNMGINLKFRPTLA